MELKYKVLMHDLSNNEYTVIATDLDLRKALSLLITIVPIGAHEKTVEYVLREI